MSHITAVVYVVTLAMLATGCVSAHKTSERGIALPNDPEALVESLAISDEPAAYAPVYTPSVDTPDSDPRVIAFAAADRLKGMGRRAFPVLLDALDDKRQSVAFRRIIPHDVGLACFCIVQDQVESVPGVWWGHRRKGPNGQHVTHPVFLTTATVREWYDKRKHWTLVQMQIEAVETLLAGERKAGFADKKQEEEVAAPYLTRLKALRGSVRKEETANNAMDTDKA